MKFTDGYWQMRPGCAPYFAAQAYDVESDGQALTVYAPTRVIRQRGDTLNLPLLTVRYSTPLAGVIRVQVTHHQGGLPPHPQFQIAEAPVTPQIVISAAAAELTEVPLGVEAHQL